MTEQEREERGAALLALYQDEWLATWRIKDFCRALVEDYDEQEVRQIARAAGQGHQAIFSSAETAAQYPPELRSPEYSPRTHATWVRKQKEEREKGNT